VQACVEPDDDLDDVVRALESNFSLLDWDGDLTGRQPEISAQAARISSVLSAAHYESAVEGAIEAIREGRISKVVLAREVIVEREADHDPAAVFAVLREAFPSCFNYAIGRGDSTFLGASPELLVRREGSRAATIALAGSAPRSADPSVDDHIGERLLRSDKDRREQAIVTDRIVASLDPHSVWVTPAAEPSVAKVANIQHLATPIRAQLRDAVSVVELLGALHPTPAVGGEPWTEAQTVMDETEGMDRGWYAAPIGWTDGSEDGEFCVALRGALLKGSQARCYAGVGVVEGSDPASELAETELKLQAVLPVLST
jgi:salicylate biosynthesis isochorismate synthase/menaquinone-specific isochorismate synthase